MISIALATYNGKKYIKEQLDSIINQTMKPDEIVIRDDLSTDGTFEFILEYSKKNENIKWNIKQNEINLGYKKNFYNSIISCSGDYIFLSDQDDIWIENKIEIMMNEKKKNDILLLMSNLQSFYQDDCKNVVKQEWLGIKRLKKKFNINHCVNTPRPGCTFCITKELVQLYKQNIDFLIPHDNLLWHIASLNKRVYNLNKITIKYRRHSSNVSNNKKNNKNKRIDAIKEQIKNIEYLIKLSNENNFFISQKKVFEKRLNNLENNKVINVFFSIIYFKYYYSWRIWLVDIYYVLKGVK